MFGRLKSIPNDSVIEKQFAGRTFELADLKGEVVKVIRGDSKWSMELLNELIGSTESEIAALQSDLDAYAEAVV